MRCKTDWWGITLIAGDETDKELLRKLNKRLLDKPIIVGHDCDENPEIDEYDDKEADEFCLIFHHG